MPTQPLPDSVLLKIQPPPRIASIERPLPEQALQRALGEQRLMLLVAPAGCVKAAVLTQAAD